MKGFDERHISPELLEKLNNAEKALKLAKCAIVVSGIVVLAEIVHVLVMFDLMVK